MLGGDNPAKVLERVDIPIVWAQVRVYQCHFYIGVRHQLAHGVDIHARHHQAAGKRVAQIVEAEAGYLRGLHYRIETPVDVVQASACTW